MAKTCKVGIDYFPFNVDFFDDDKIKLIEAEFGGKGIDVTIRLLAKIYKEGYYYKWGRDECLLFAGARFVPSFVDEVISGLVRRCFFNEGCFNQFKILTSKAIQSRYFDAVRRYKKVDVIPEYLLVNVSDMKNVYINGVNANIYYQNAGNYPHNNNGNNNGSGTKASIPPDFSERIRLNSESELSKTFKDLADDIAWLEVIAMNNQLKSIDKVLERLNAFYKKLQNEGETKKSISDAKSHFARWLNINKNAV